MTWQLLSWPVFTLIKKNTKKAVLYFKQIDTISPDFEGYEYGYSQALHKEHQVQEALRIAKKGLEKNPLKQTLVGLHIFLRIAWC